MIRKCITEGVGTGEGAVQVGHAQQATEHVSLHVQQLLALPPTEADVLPRGALG